MRFAVTASTPSQHLRMIQIVSSSATTTPTAVLAWPLGILSTSVPTQRLTLFSLTVMESFMAAFAARKRDATKSISGPTAVNLPP
eukprot:3904586-Prymnesium_polylepis.1